MKIKKGKNKTKKILATTEDAIELDTIENRTSFAGQMSRPLLPQAQSRAVSS